MIRRKLSTSVPTRFLGASAVLLAFALITPQFVKAQTSTCVDCHTMHNSQDALPMRYDSQTTPLAQLLRGDCFGCHAQGLPNAIVTTPSGNTKIPQVYHTDFALDLAGGNFAYIDGTKGGAPSDSKGHNIAALAGMGSDATLTVPPGGIIQSQHFGAGSNLVTSAQLTCAGDISTNGRFGCHGNRAGAAFGLYGIDGAHHDNQSGQLTPNAGEMRAGYGYRFLVGVQGYEDTDWQYTVSGTDHNEYFGRLNPTKLSCSTDQCHGAGGVRPPNGTMSEFCATCHGNFHTLSVGSGDGVTPGSSSGIGNGASPFIRHPADYALPVAGDYAGYVTYSLSAPIARTAVPASSGNVVNPGADSVMCLSCHIAHGSQYPDMLRFDYTLMDIGAGGAATGTGCFKCHSSKD